MADQRPPYDVQQHKRVRKFLQKHEGLKPAWLDVEAALRQNPLPRPDCDIVHTKGEIFCGYRWREGDYRFLYDVYEDTRVVWVYDVDSRGQIYR